MKTNAARILDAKGITYRIMTYNLEDEFDAVAAAYALNLEPEIVYKTLLVKGERTGPLAAVIPSNQQLDLKALSAVSGNKAVTMVPLSQIQALTGYVRGGVSPVGMKKRFPTFIDVSVFIHEEVGISGGKKGVELLLNGKDLCTVAQGILCDITIKP